MILVAVNAKTMKKEVIIKGDPDELVGEFVMLMTAVLHDDKATYCFDQAIAITQRAVEKAKEEEKGERHFDA